MRTSILWVEDQKEFAKAYFPMLKNSGIRCSYASNGNSALELLLKNYYELLLLDLKMPPNNWGGLWLLKEMKDLGINLPVLIISGEGSQNETIQALRLGVKDYLHKECLRDSLIPTIFSLVEKDTSSIFLSFCAIKQTILSVPFKRINSASSYSLKIDRIVEFVEVFVKLIDFIGYSICISKNISFDDIPLKLDKLSPAFSTGAWNQMRFEFKKILSCEVTYGRLNNIINDQFVNKIVEIRNNEVHGFKKTESDAKAIYDDIEDDFIYFVKSIYSNFSVELFFPTSLFFDGNSYEISVLNALGDGFVFPNKKIISKNPIQCKKIHYYYNEHFLPCNDLIVMDSEIDCTVDKLYIFDSVQCNSRSKLYKRYTNLLSGERRELFF